MPKIQLSRSEQEKINRLINRSKWEEDVKESANEFQKRLQPGIEAPQNLIDEAKKVCLDHDEDDLKLRKIVKYILFVFIGAALIGMVQNIIEIIQGKSFEHLTFITIGIFISLLSFFCYKLSQPPKNLGLAYELIRQRKFEWLEEEIMEIEQVRKRHNNQWQYYYYAYTDSPQYMNKFNRGDVNNSLKVGDHVYAIVFENGHPFRIRKI